ncbi:MAG: uracil-DNA glycosylase family protein [Anaerolineales bacterium]
MKVEVSCTHLLVDLHSRMRDCRLCLEEGYEIFPRAIFSGGMGARLMVIGQAPGITEKEARRPFNAGSGTRLFKWLGEAGVEETWFRDSQYMTAVTKCYPGRSKSGSGDRVPTSSEQSFCRPHLDEEIILINPELIIPVGSLAISIFYPNKISLKDIIGTQKQVDGRWIVPLPHPSGASRWHQIEANRDHIGEAVALIRHHVEHIFAK